MHILVKCGLCALRFVTLPVWGIIDDRTVTTINIVYIYVWCHAISKTTQTHNTNTHTHIYLHTNQQPQRTQMQISIDVQCTVHIQSFIQPPLSFEFTFEHTFLAMPELYRKYADVGKEREPEINRTKKMKKKKLQNNQQTSQPSTTT